MNNTNPLRLRERERDRECSEPDALRLRLRLVLLWFDVRLPDRLRLPDLLLDPERERLKFKIKVFLVSKMTKSFDLLKCFKDYKQYLVRLPLRDLEPLFERSE